MNNNIEIQLNELGITNDPSPAGKHLELFLKRKGISIANASKALSVSHSTLSRLIAGGRLTEELAEKLVVVYGLSAKILFRAQADYQASVVLKRLNAA